VFVPLSLYEITAHPESRLFHDIGPTERLQVSVKLG